jgi:hypothetical protein
MMARSCPAFRIGPMKRRRFNAELAEHAEKSLEFFSAGFAVSAFNVIGS